MGLCKFGRIDGGCHKEVCSVLKERLSDGNIRGRWNTRTSRENTLYMNFSLSGRRFYLKQTWLCYLHRMDQRPTQQILSRLGFDI
jgi:hypothetical protein